MTRLVRLNQVDTVLRLLEYPIDVETAANDCGDVIVELAEGSVNLGETLSQSASREFLSARDLEEELFGLLPRHAVGEPYQSDGDA